MKININTRTIEYIPDWSGTITYDEVVERAGYETYRGLTVTFQGGEDNGHGSLVKGGAVRVKEGMIFEVANTNNA